MTLGSPSLLSLIELYGFQLSCFSSSLKSHFSFLLIYMLHCMKMKIASAKRIVWNSSANRALAVHTIVMIQANCITKSVLAFIVISFLWFVLFPELPVYDFISIIPFDDKLCLVYVGSVSVQSDFPNLEFVPVFFFFLLYPYPVSVEFYYSFSFVEEGAHEFLVKKLAPDGIFFNKVTRSSFRAGKFSKVA